MASAVKLLVAALVLSACSAKTTPSVRDSNSNWLATCDVTADCDGEGACICGLCTATCSDDDDCDSAGPGASCVRPGAASGEVACAAIVEAAGQNVCLAECADDGDCRAGSSCNEGACWASPSAVIDQRDSGAKPPAPVPDAGITQPPLGHEIPDNIWEIDAAVSFEEPTARPAPVTELRGEAIAALIGVWGEELGRVHYWGSPMTLTIIEDATTRRVTGTISFSCEPGPGCEFSTEPLPAATDPDEPYPPGIDASMLQDVRYNMLPFFPYRMFDARLEAERFAFWFTNNDPWRDWCPLQSPYPAMVAGLQRYACLPDARSHQELQLDPEVEGKDVLCATDLSPCSCMASGCALDYHSAIRTLDLEIVDRETLRGFYVSNFETHFVTLKRQVAP